MPVEEPEAVSVSQQSNQPPPPRPRSSRGLAEDARSEGRPRPAWPIVVGLTFLGCALGIAFAIRSHENHPHPAPTEALEQVQGPHAHHTWIPEIVAAGGALNALLLGLALHLARVGRWRSDRLLAAKAHSREHASRRAEAEAAEREARDELRNVVNAFPDHVWSAHVSADGAFHPRYYSPVVEDISGYPPHFYKEDESRWIGLILPEDREAVSRGYQSIVQGEADSCSLEYRIRRADGEIRTLRDRLRGSDMSYGRRMDGVVTDVTDLKAAEHERLRLESSFQQAQRLESLGVLAGGIAHDFNNLLVGMLGHADLALQQLEADDPARRDIASIERAARRAAELCRQMLAYAGKGSLKTESLDLRQSVEEMGELLAASIQKNVITRYAFEEGLPLVEADASQIRQVVMNLITNAAESFRGLGGTIQVSARAVFRSRSELATFLAGEDCEPGCFVELTVADDGCGMDEGTQGRIFEPFYTTKFAGRGLGLAAALGIARRHLGAIRVESEVDKGTAVTLLLPALEPGTREVYTPAPPCSPWRGDGVVLLVDDAEDAREVGATMLERGGFRVLCASEGSEALEIFRRHREEIVCVVLDLTMPGMDGTQTFHALRRLSARTPVILCSGYPEEEVIQRYEGLGLAGFLQKPYTSEELLARLRDALEGGSPPS